MNETGHKILFRDKRRRLCLYNIDTQSKSSLLSYSTYVQWVPQSDVVIAQSNQNLCIWYNIDAPERVTTFPLKVFTPQLARPPAHARLGRDCGD